MGIDYSGIGGVGIGFTDELVEKAIEKGIFTNEEWDEDSYGCVEKVDILFHQAGNSYTGEFRYYFMVDGNTLGDINRNALGFVKQIQEKFGVTLVIDDLKVIEDGHIW